MKRAWHSLGGQLGLLAIGIGIVVIVLGWNGAAGEFEVDAQVPYLLSGGAAGLALVGLGMALLVVQNSRRDRTLLEARFEELSRSISRLAGTVADQAVDPAGASTLVAAGNDSFHRLDCRLVDGKDLPRITVHTARREGLAACRICNPPAEEHSTPSAH
jgi:hypothetical protein